MYTNLFHFLLCVITSTTFAQCVSTIIFSSSNNPIQWNEDNVALNNFGEPSVWLNNTQDDLLKRIWFDHQKSLTGYDSFFGNASSELGKVLKTKDKKQNEK